MFEDISKVVLVCDMDGTLLTTKKTISDRDKAAISRFIADGGKFTIATGRTIHSFRNYYDMLDLRLPLIMYNGAAIYDNNADKVLYTVELPDISREITHDILNAMPNIGGEVLKADGIYVFENTHYEALHTKITGVTPFYSKLDDIADGGWLKVLFSMAPEDVLRLELYVKSQGYKDVSFVKSAEILYEMLPLGVTKGSALSHYRKIPGMENCTFVAIGDFDNDIEMLIEADLGAAPSNAQPNVMDAADMVLKNSCDTGAIAELIDIIYKKLN